MKIRFWMLKARLEREMSQKDVATQLGMTQASYSAWERGYRRRDMPVQIVERLANVFGIAPEEAFASECEYAKKHSA